MKKTSIYGAGYMGMKVLKALSENGVKVNFFIDQFTNEKFILGIPVYRLSDISEPQNTIVYLSIHEGLYNYPDVVSGIMNSGFDIVSLHDIARTYESIIPSVVNDEILYLRKDKNKMIDALKTREVLALISSPQSKKNYENLLNFRADPRPATYPAPTEDNQYLTNQVDIYDRCDFTYIDCGAYTGDTIKKALDYTGKRLKTVFAFEPDLSNFSALVNECRSPELENTAIHLYPCGVWNHTGVVNFSNDGTSSSKISLDKGNCTVPVVALDDVIINKKVDLIKMDLEGAELMAIEGCKNIIRSQSPSLAISIYHKPEDLWEIPLYINSLNPGYNMYVETYGFMGFETVLFCSKN
ncbi:MAG: FkbM family methyltransferase [Magnetospirillum sp.]